jgi:hypothetical protein
MPACVTLTSSGYVSTERADDFLPMHLMSLLVRISEDPDKIEDFFEMKCVTGEVTGAVKEALSDFVEIDINVNIIPVCRGRDDRLEDMMMCAPLILDYQDFALLAAPLAHMLLASLCRLLVCV